MKALEIAIESNESILRIGTLIKECRSLDTIKSRNFQKEEHPRLDYYKDADFITFYEAKRNYNIYPNPSIKTLTTPIILYTTSMIQCLQKNLSWCQVSHFELSRVTSFSSFEKKMQHSGHQVSSASWINFLKHVCHNIPTFQLSNLYIKRYPEVLSSLLDTYNFKKNFHMEYCDNSSYNTIAPRVYLSRGQFETRRSYQSK